MKLSEYLHLATFMGVTDIFSVYKPILESIDLEGEVIRKLKEDNITGEGKDHIISKNGEKYVVVRFWGKSAQAELWQVYRGA